MKRSIKSSAVLTIAATLAISFATLATAQNDALANLYLSAANVPTNIAGIHTYAEPPKGFNPVAATDIELATYGFPPRPDKYADSDHYALWERAMSAAKIRCDRGAETDARPRTRDDASQLAVSRGESAAVLTGPKHLSTVNGSGVFLTNYGIKKWSSTASFNDIWTVISVPVATQPFDNTAGCTASDYLSVSFAGIDGRLVFYSQAGFSFPSSGRSCVRLQLYFRNDPYYAYADGRSGVTRPSISIQGTFSTQKFTAFNRSCGSASSWKTSGP